MPNRDIVFAPQNFFGTVRTHCYYNQIDISFSGGPSQSQPSERTHDLECAREGEMCRCCASHTSNTRVTLAVTLSRNLDEIEGRRCIWIWLALFGIEIQFQSPVFVPEQHTFSNSNSISTKYDFGWYLEILAGSRTGPKLAGMAGTLHFPIPNGATPRPGD